MRTLLLTRGMPASGKDYWIKQNNLEQYSLSADNIRLLLQSPVTSLNGNLEITQKNDGKVWTMLFEILEQRMERGEFVIVNATHYKKELLTRYKKLIDKYRYRAYIVDFTDVSLDVCLKRNRERDSYKFVPEEVLHKMHAVFEAEKNIASCKEVSNKFTILNRNEALEVLKQNVLYDFTNEYKKIVVFGDVHGCFAPIEDYFKANPINDSYKYIFTGDYIDRGIQNKEVLEFLLEHMNKPNFLILEGNHCAHLKKYCSNEYKEVNIDLEDKKVLKKYLTKTQLNELSSNNIKSSLFKEKTIPEIQDIDKGSLRQFCRKLAQMAYFKFGKNVYLITHGGLSNVPTIFTPTQEFIKGVGKYENLEEIYNSWNNNTPDNYIQIHSHRNIFKLPIKASDRIYNLCDEPEYGKFLRIIEINEDNSVKEILQPSNVYDENLVVPETQQLDLNLNQNDILAQLKKSKNIQKKILENNIASYNFTRKAFQRGKWDNLTCKARGLFVNEDNGEVIARGYNKFFGW